SGDAALKQKKRPRRTGARRIWFWVEASPLRGVSQRASPRGLSRMLKLTDSELDAVFSAARPLDPDLRDPFLQAVANALMADCSGEIGPRTVARLPRNAAPVL